MEDILTQLMKDVSKIQKYTPIRKTCAAALDLLDNQQLLNETPAYVLREKCLEPLQYALESRAKKLATYAIAGIQQILKDGRFQSSMESDQENNWLPIQVLNTVFSTPTLPEDTQVEILKLLLSMTFATSFCMNARVITEVSQVYIDTYTASTHSVRGAVKAALTQLLSSFAEKLQEVADEGEEDGNDVLADFKAKAGSVNTDSLSSEVVAILRFFTGKLESASGNNQNKQAVPLLLEGVYTVIINSPPYIRDHKPFQEILWKHLCPCMISLLGTPKSERSAMVPKSVNLEDVGRGSGCSLTAPNLQSSTAKTIYSIAVSLVELMGPVGSLRPVLESVFHRMLLYPPPQHRLDALKAVKELFKTPASLFNLAYPTLDLETEESTKNAAKNPNIDVSLLKLIVDALQESCHCNDSAVCFTSVTCVDEMLGSLEQISRGVGITDGICQAVDKYYAFLQRALNRTSSMRSDHDGGAEIDLDLNQQVSDLDLSSKPMHQSNGECQDIDSDVFMDNHPEGSTSQTDDTETSEEVELEDTDRLLHIKSVSPYKARTRNQQSLTCIKRKKERLRKREKKRKDQSYKDPLKIIRWWAPRSLWDLLFRRHRTQMQTLGEEIRRRYSKLGSEYEVVERENARSLIAELCRILPHISKMFSVPEVDEALQNFSSNFCTALYDQQYQSVSKDASSCQMAILNADGVYVATVTALLLNLKLETSGYYSTGSEADLPYSEKQFLDEVLGSGLLLFLSPAWLSEVYQQITSTNILQKTGCTSEPESSLMQLLKDIDGLGSHEKGGQLLSNTGLELYSLESADVQGSVENQHYIATGKKFSKRILSKCWEGVLDVLSVLLNGKSSCGITSSLALMLGTEGAKEESHRAREAICMSLDGLQKAARLCCTLGLQQRCGSVFSQLAGTSCVLVDTQKIPVADNKPSTKPTILSNKPKPVRLHASHILSMDVVMTNGLEMGSHSADCWKHVFRCSAFISELEHTYFSSGNNQSSLPKVQQEQTMELDTQEICDDSEMYSVPVSAAVPVAPRINIPDLIKQSSIESGWERSLTGGGVLNSAQASQALCGLSQEVDRLFEDAAQKLNLSALVNFISELSDASQLQINKMVKHLDDDDHDSQQLPLNALHIYRLQEVLMKIVHSDRPLIHLMRLWSIVTAHLVEAAGHHDRSVSKLAVTCVHDFILAMLGNHPELPHFHVNELLCKTFENMLCLELCDGDVQDQIVCSICELVEACTADIRSGWRPLFGALRAVKIEYTTNEEVNEARQRHVAAVLDVFEVYLNTDNILVFANATVDCILCLLKYVRGPGEFDDDSDDDTDSGSDFGLLNTPGGENLCIPALRYLKHCSRILQTMWKMPSCPVFNGAHRIHTDSSQQSVDPKLPNMCMEDFSKHFTEILLPQSNNNPEKQEDHCEPLSGKKDNLVNQNSIDEEEKVLDNNSINSVDSGITLNSLEKSENSINQSKSCLKSKPASDLPKQTINVSVVEDTLESMDNQSGILHVWFLLLDGLAGSVSACPKAYQPDTLEMMFSLLKSAADIPGPTFGLYCVNRLLLPMIQSWLRTGIRRYGYWESGATNFKQCCGLCTDLVVEFTKQFAGSRDKTVQLVEVMLKQLLDILIECVAQPVEVISRLGCSCIRHVLLSAGQSFTEQMWQIGVEAIQRALNVTTFHLQQLMFLFEVNSENFYGDKGQVKVAMRRDSTAAECQRLQHLAHQVFLLDSQVNECPVHGDTEEDKSFVFLLYPPGQENSLNPDTIVARIPFRGVVVGLLSNQLLLQTVGSVLLKCDNPKSVSQVNGNHNDSQSKDKEDNTKNSTADLGMISLMSTRNVLTLLKCLKSSNKFAFEFDSRPGLKFLIQKVARTEVAVNLYKQVGASMIFYMNTLLQICVSFQGVSRTETREVLSNKQHDAMDIYKAINEHSNNTQPITQHRGLFIQLLYGVCNDLCQMYVDMLSDDRINRVDEMAEREVFFLIAQPDDITDIMRRRRKRSLLDKEGVHDAMQVDGVLGTEAVALQDEPLTDSYDNNSIENKTQDSDSESEQEEVEIKNTRNAGKSKRQLREEQDNRVYTLATDTLIRSLMTEYKKRKQQHAMPSFVKITKQKKQAPPQKKTDGLDEVIEKQQKSSIMKDSEARSQSLTELLCTILGLFQQLPDEKFDALLPSVFNCVNQLVCHADDAKLKDALGQYIHRIGLMMHLMPSSS